MQEHKESNQIRIVQCLSHTCHPSQLQKIVNCTKLLPLKVPSILIIWSNLPTYSLLQQHWDDLSVLEAVEQGEVFIEGESFSAPPMLLYRPEQAAAAATSLFHSG